MKNKSNSFLNDLKYNQAISKSAIKFNPSPMKSETNKQKLDNLMRKSMGTTQGKAINPFAQ